jgi:hypothetical protein
MRLVDGRYVDEIAPVEEPTPGPEVIAEGVERQPAMVNRWLVAALVAALLVIVAGGSWLCLDGRQTADEREVAVVIAANERVWDAGDGAGVLKTMTRAGSWAAELVTTSEGCDP